ncbi:MAG: arginase family protein [Holophagaceae bacterium]|uniref:Arginase family protein n=1 Tax=Candidatus Geothrix skivensis TaxID=2954439 RepID=A0A9D7SHD6_9BACT|nr:arginase family protein [Candidatus Geothrix skivensis]
MSADVLMRGLRTGLTPFLGLPLCLDPRPATGVVLGVPCDAGVINRPGARLGPWALRAASMGLGTHPMPERLREGRPVLGPAATEGWLDGGNIPTLPFSLAGALEAVQATVGAWAMNGCRTLLLGGDHSLTLGALRALARQHGPLGLLHVDAHPDAADGAAWGTDIHHGTWLRQALEEGLLDPERVLQAGLRAPRFDDEELYFLRSAGVRMWTPTDLRDPLLAPTLYEDLASIGRGPAYLSLDLDALDPSLVPAVAEPVPGGLSLAETLGLIHAAREWPDPWLGADLMELAPTLEGAEASARIAVHLALHLLA